MIPKYFQGENLHGAVSASDAQSFEDIVAILGHAPKLDINRAAFFALPEEKRNELKRVRFLVPAVFKQSPSARQKNEALHCNLLMLDIDPEKEYRDGKWVETGRFPAKPFVDDPSCLHTALAGFNFAAHTTASSTKEKPRMRIVVEADSIPAEDYPSAIRTIGEMLALGKVTKESQVSVQPMFAPVVFRDDPADYHPMLTQSLKGRAFTAKDISENLADEYSKPRPSGEVDDLDFLRAPVSEFTLALAKEALAKIDPDIDRAKWLEVAASLRHQFSPNEAEEAYQLFDEWSATGTKYGGEDDTQKLWDSLRPTPVGRAPKTIRSLIKLAVESGWDDKKFKDKELASVQNWIDDVESASALVDQGLRKIAAIPDLSSTQERRLLEAIRTKGKDRFHDKLIISDLRDDLEALRSKIKEAGRKDEKTKMPAWAKGVCYVGSTLQFYRQRTGEKYSLNAFNSTYAHHLTKTEDNEGARPFALPSDYVLNFLKIPKVYDYAYNPAKPTEVFFIHRDRHYVNTYSPTYPELDDDRASNAGALLHNHLRHLIHEPAYQRVVTDFLAFMVQHPGVKIRWAIFIQSAEGAGKTFLAQLMRAVLGKEHVRVISGESINKGWNEWSFGRQLVVLEEVRAVGISRHTVMTALKQLITNDDIPIDQRNRDTREEENIVNYILFSNFHDALALTPNNRRYFVLKSPLQTKEQVAALGKDYFPPLFNMLRDNPGAMRSWLLNWKISPDFNPNAGCPHTVYEKEMIGDSANELHSAIRRLLLEADSPLIQYDICSSRALGEALMQEGIRGHSLQTIAAVLRDEGFRTIHGRHLFGDERHYLWIRAGVDEATAASVARERVQKGAKNLGMEIYF